SAVVRATPRSTGSDAPGSMGSAMGPDPPGSDPGFSTVAARAKPGPDPVGSDPRSAGFSTVAARAQPGSDPAGSDPTGPGFSTVAARARPGSDPVGSDPRSAGFSSVAARAKPGSAPTGSDPNGGAAAAILAAGRGGCGVRPYHIRASVSAETRARPPSTSAGRRRWLLPETGASSQAKRSEGAGIGGAT